MSKSRENISLEIQDNSEVNEDENSTTFETQSKIQQNSHLFKMMILQQKVLNKRIGTQAWKKYLSAAFWNYITTPINFSITLLTAIATGQAATSNILSQEQTLIILFVTFVLTTTNSFFKLNTKMNLNFEAARSYYTFGGEFEKIYYTPLFNDLDVKAKLDSYELLHQNMNTYMVSETIENQNYVTEMIYFLVSWAACCACLGNITEWIVESERNDDLEGGRKDTVKNKLEHVIMSAFGKNSLEIDDLKTKFMSFKDKINCDIQAQQKNINEKNTYERRFENMLKEQQKIIDDLHNKIYLLEKPKSQLFSQTSDSKEVENRVVMVNKDEKEKDTSPLNNDLEISSDNDEDIKEDDEKEFVREEITRHFCDINKYMNDVENDKFSKIMKAINEVVQKTKEETTTICGEKYDYSKVIFEPRYSFHLIEIFDEAYSKILKLTELITDEYVKSKITEIFFLVDRENRKKLTITMIPIFYKAIVVFLNNAYIMLKSKGYVGLSLIE